MTTAQARIDRTQNEGAEGYSLAAQHAADASRARMITFEAEQAAALAASRAAFAADWTLDVLTARRTAWNAEMAALSAKRTKMTATVMSAVVAKLGYTMQDLANAKRLHGIA